MFIASDGNPFLQVYNVHRLSQVSSGHPQSYLSSGKWPHYSTGPDPNCTVIKSSPNTLEIAVQCGAYWRVAGGKNCVKYLVLGRFKREGKVTVAQ